MPTSVIHIPHIVEVKICSHDHMCKDSVSTRFMLGLRLGFGVEIRLKTR